MGREVPYDPTDICDECGREGAYDFYGDYICQECIDQLKKKENEG